MARLTLNSDRTILREDGEHWHGHSRPSVHAPLLTYPMDTSDICKRLELLHAPQQQREPAPVRPTPPRKEGRSNRTDIETQAHNRVVQMDQARLYEELVRLMAAGGQSNESE